MRCRDPVGRRCHRWHRPRVLGPYQDRTIDFSDNTPNGMLLAGSNRAARLHCLKFSAQRELQVTFAAPRTCSAFSEDLAEGGGVGRIQPNVGGPAAPATPTPVGVIPDVESLGPELQAEAFGNGNRLEQSHIPIPESGLIDN